VIWLIYDEFILFAIYAILLIEYLSCDNNIPAGKLITDEEIIEVVLEENDEQDESNANEEADIRPTISLPEAFTGLTQFLHYSTEPEIPLLYSVG